MINSKSEEILFNTYLPPLTFTWGGSSVPYIDCVGLVICYLRWQGKVCRWEEDIRREFTTFESGLDHMLSEQFVPDPEGDIFLLNVRPYAHIGFIEKDIAYHLALTGISAVSSRTIEHRFRYEGL